MSVTFPSIEEFLQSEEGNVVSFLTRCSSYDIPFPKKIKRTKFQCKTNHMDVVYYDFEEFDLFVFQGTSGLFDIVADLKMILGIKPSQFKSALEFVEKYIDRDKKTYISGHSLGGAITQYIVHEFEEDENIVGVSYNGAGIKHLLNERNEYKIYNFISTKDILNNITMILPSNYFKHIGDIKIINDQISKNCIKAHSNFEIFLI